MNDLPKCKLCGSDAAMHKVFGGIKYCCSSETCTMHDVLMLKNQWRTLMGQQQAAPVGVVREFHVDWRDHKPPEGTELYSYGSLGPSLLEQSDLEFIAARLGRVAKRVGYPMPSGDAQFIVSVSGSILGAIARILDGDTREKQAQPAPIPTADDVVCKQQAEPVAYGVKSNEESGFIFSLGFSKKLAENQCSLLGGHVVPLYTAPQAQQPDQDRLRFQPAQIPTAWQPIETAPTDVLHVRGLWVYDDKGQPLSFDCDTGRIDDDGFFVDEFGNVHGLSAGDYTHWHPLEVPPAPGGEG